MFTSFKRILGFALNDFSRNKGISIAAIFVLVVMIMLISGLIFFHGISSYLTNEIQDKIDIAAYFKEDASEEDILSAKEQIANMAPGIKSIEYVSREQALAIFNERHQDNAILSKALQEVGNNPFLPSLNITTNGDPVQYAQIANILETSDFGKMIEKVDFSEKKMTIEKIYSITTSINASGIILSLILAVLAMLVVFNTIKLAIENSKEEISTMRIVGASDSFVRGPFIICGLIYGLIAFAFCFIATAVAAFLISSRLEVLTPGFSALGYFLTNWWIFVLIQLLFGIGVGVVSSFIVVKKYLDI